MNAAAARISLLVGLVALLELLCRTGVIPSFTVIPPSAMVQSLWKVLASGKFTPDIVATLTNVGIAIAAAMIAGLALGTALQSWPAARRVLDPLFATYYALPMYAVYPLLIVLYGLATALLGGDLAAAAFMAIWLLAAGFGLTMGVRKLIQLLRSGRQPRPGIRTHVWNDDTPP